MGSGREGLPTMGGKRRGIYVSKEAAEPSMEEFQEKGLIKVMLFNYNGGGSMNN